MSESPTTVQALRGIALGNGASGNWAIRKVARGFRLNPGGSILTLFTYAFVASTMVPLLWLLSTSFKTRLDAFALPPKWLFDPTFKNYAAVFGRGTFTDAYLHSLVAVVATTAFTLIFGISSGYALARVNTRGMRIMGFWVLAVRMVPPIVFAMPFYLLFREFGLLNTYPALVLVYMTITLPFATWLLAGYFRTIPVELEEAAMIDGTTRVGALFRVVLPAAKPGIATAAIFAFISSWNEFFYALIVSGPGTQPVSVAIQGFLSSAGVDFGQLSAAAVLVVLPVFVFSLFAQRGLVGGLTHGAVK